MTTLKSRPDTALLVVDMRVGVIASAHGRDPIVKNVETLVAKARRDRVSVIWSSTPTISLRRGVTRGGSFPN